MSNDLREPLVPELPINDAKTVRVEKPDAAGFVQIWAACPCCGKRMWLRLRTANDLLVAESGHQP